MGKKNLSGSEAYKGGEGVAELRAKVGLPPLKKGTCICLKCEKPFTSEDVKRIRVCFNCKSQDSYRDSPPRADLYPNFGSGFSGRGEHRTRRTKKEYLDDVKGHGFVKKVSQSYRRRELLKQNRQRRKVARAQQQIAPKAPPPTFHLEDDYATEVEVAHPRRATSTNLYRAPNRKE